MLISDRSKEIIENLMNANGPLTVSALSKKLGVLVLLNAPFIDRFLKLPRS